MGTKYKLFEVFGIELEYMLINDTTFKVAPIVDVLLTKKNGELTSGIANGTTTFTVKVYNYHEKKRQSLLFSATTT